MKLFRLELNGKGIFHAEPTISQVVDKIRDRELGDKYYNKHSYNQFLMHCPTENQFKGGIRPPEEARFYFTEDGFNTFAEYIDMILEMYDLYTDHTVEVIELDIQEHECVLYYEDFAQVCIEILK